MIAEKLSSFFASSGLSAVFQRLKREVQKARRRMDQQEAERLAKLIERTRVEWIQVRGIEYSPLVGTYELNCLYRRERALTGWSELRLRSPRQWIDLLTKRSDDFGGLELP